MHGGGGVPKDVNDQQWHKMFEQYYKDHPEAGGYIYLALRAPDDVWNGFYDDAICPMVERLIRQFVEARLRSGIPRIVTDPDPGNARAVRAYEKAGFARLRRIDTPDGPALLMAYDQGRLS